MEQKIRTAIARVNSMAISCPGNDLILELGIDSHDIFNIIVELEEEFDIEIEPIYLRAENFNSFLSIENMICEIRRESEKY